MFDASKSGVVIALFLIGLAASFAGSPPGAITYVHETCYDGIDNDVDGVYGGSFPLIIADEKDGECIWMPHKTYGNGEFDGQGTNDPLAGDLSVDSYVQNWILASSSETPTHFEMVKALIIESSGAFSCSNGPGLDLQDSLSAYKNQYGLSNDLTGANEHMIECGVSY